MGEEMFKKGQVTIFVIVGLILLVGVLFLVLSLKNNKTVFISDDVSVRFDQYLTQCSDYVINDYVSKALITGGYGEYPLNVVRAEDNLYVLSFDSEGLYYGIYDTYLVSYLLEYKISSVKDCLVPLIENDLEIYNQEIILNSLNYEAMFEDNTIIVNYEYEYSFQGNTFNNMIMKSYNTNLGYFLNRANELTNMFLEEQETDEFFNYQFCNLLFEEKGYAPKYSVDFLKNLEGDEAKFYFEQEFYIVYLEKGNEVFPFAIMPFHERYYC